MKRNPREHICSDAAHQQCICEQETKRRIGCPVFFSPHLAISNCMSKGRCEIDAASQTCHLLPKLQGSHQRAKPFRKFKMALSSRSCRSSCGPLRSCDLRDRFWNPCSTLRSKIFSTACFRAAITLQGSEVRTCVLAAARDHQTGVTSPSTTLLRVRALESASDLACKR